MPIFEPGDIVRVPFPYTDGLTQQRRPALVVSSGPLADGLLLWVVMITSAENRRWSGDVAIQDPVEETRIPIPSVVRPVKIATIDASRAETVGRVRPQTLAKVLAQIEAVLGIANLAAGQHERPIA